MSAKKKVLQKCEFSYTFFQWISYNNMVYTKQFFFSLTFLKWQGHISDNFADVVEGKIVQLEGI